MINAKAVEIFNQFPPASISISIYGKDEESYFRVTGRKGMYDKVINTFNLLSKNSIHFEIKYIGMKETKTITPQFVLLLKSMERSFPILWSCFLH